MTEMGGAAVDDGYEAPHAEPGMDRRRFVKGGMAAAAVSAGAAASFGMFKQATIPSETAVRYLSYLGARIGPRTPAPRGLPFIPVRVNDDGLVEAIPERDGVNYLDLLRYCTVADAPQLASVGHTRDNVLRFQLVDSHVHDAGDRADELFWFRDRHGREVRAADFKARPYGAGAAVRWRSEGVPASQQVNLILMKLDPAAFPQGSEAFLEDFMDPEQHLVALSGHCTHFCCTPGYKYTEKAHSFDGWEKVYCSCHHSVFDPYDATEYTFMLREQRGE